MSRIFALVAVVLVFLAGATAIDAAHTQSPTNSTKSDMVPVFANMYDVSASIIPLIVVVASVLGAAAILGRIR